MVRRIVLSAVCAVALSAAAHAADVIQTPAAGGYRDAPIAWDGCYAGINGGYAWSAWSDQLAGSGFAGLSPSGGFGGVQAGWNSQRGNVVFGIEGDVQFAGIGASGNDATGNNYKSELDWFGTVRARAGIPFNRALVYVTGGIAVGGIHNTADGVYSQERAAVGWVGGGGVEYKITPSWSVKGEYQYIDLGRTDPLNSAGTGYSTAGGTTVNKDAFNTVRIGLNLSTTPAHEPIK
jgi:outer membrane immunogenic protein